MPERSPRFKSVFFDFDGTLADSYGAITASVNHVRACRELPPLTEPDVRPYVGRGLENLLADLVPGSDIAIDCRRYRDHHPSVLRCGTRLLPGAMETLSALKKGGVRLGICSNKPPVFTRELITILDLEPFFDVLLGPGDVAHIKPAPDMLLEGARRFGVKAEETLYVGDMVIDILTARAAGMEVWVVPTGSEERAALEAAKPDRILTGLSEVPRLVLETG